MLTAIGTLGAGICVFLVLCAYLLAAALVHEAGHIAAGLLAGFEIFSVRVGPIKLRLKMTREWSFSKSLLLGGRVIAQFHKIPGPQAPWQCFAYLAGGSVANLCASAVFIPFAFNRTVGGAIAGYFAVVSAYFGTVNLFPFKTKIGHSDGAKLFWLIFKKRRREALIFRLSLISLLNEVLALSRNGKFEEALAKTDDLIRRSAEIPNSNEGLAVVLSKIRTDLKNARVPDP